MIFYLYSLYNYILINPTITSYLLYSHSNQLQYNYKQ